MHLVNPVFICFPDSLWGKTGHRHLILPLHTGFGPWTASARSLEKGLRERRRRRSSWENRWNCLSCNNWNESMEGEGWSGACCPGFSLHPPIPSFKKMYTHPPNQPPPPPHGNLVISSFLCAKLLLVRTKGGILEPILHQCVLLVSL